MEKSSPWKYHKPGSKHIYRPPVYGSSRRKFHVAHDPQSKFDEHYEENGFPDIHSKRAALKVSESVVSLTSDTAQGKDMENGLSQASGFVIECEEINLGYLITILTTASLLKCPDVQPSDFEVDVHLFNGKSYKGEVLTFDFHYNLAMIRIKSETSLPVAILRRLDNIVSIDLSVQPSSQDSQLLPHSELCNMIPGDRITAVGRYFKHPYDIMIAPGVFSAEGLTLDCKELLRANCCITKSGTGGPLLNHHGDVVGITFYRRVCTPFLPINIVSKWLEHFKRYGDFRRPLLGMQVTNLYAARGEFLEKFLYKFPGTGEGVHVGKVAKTSPAFEAGVHEDDVIIQCGGKVIQSTLQLFEAIFDMAGKSTRLVVKRAPSDAQMNLTLIVGEATPDNFNRWPIPPKVRERIGPPYTRGC